MVLFEEAKGIVTRLILPKLQSLAGKHDYKTELQELIQQKKGQVLQYRVLEEKGPDHCKEFLVQVLLNDKEIGRGEGTSKKRAEQAAARCALSGLKK